ncbi:DUF1360 domain-containing protein [Bailinhaonella thermotolerans]|uniref:DUF1360 domain-containing protein n=1 Tax=Bailinhaonella thermotolerans TaxID=1070861 RepID=A0A3A4B3L9_9ACTN|nr:DUF1360 domain-containing protein [Bailinhaonella thermotolerans]RJL31980.1 DUF1360 domain-containing protein [Bailinhaonella thermotolerans]
MSELIESMREEQRRYEDGQHRPLKSYAAVMGLYGAAVAGLVALGRVTGRRLPEAVRPLDIALMAITTHKLARMIAKDPVTSPIRAPFTRYKGVSGPSELTEEVRGTGARKAVGELLTCPFCTAQWVATGYAAGLVFAPRFTRVAGTTMTAVAAADWLQLVYKRLLIQADETSG